MVFAVHYTQWAIIRLKLIVSTSFKIYLSIFSTKIYYLFKFNFDAPCVYVSKQIINVTTSFFILNNTIYVIFEQKINNRVKCTIWVLVSCMLLNLLKSIYICIRTRTNDTDRSMLLEYMSLRYTAFN